MRPIRSVDSILSVFKQKSTPSNIRQLCLSPGPDSVPSVFNLLPAEILLTIVTLLPRSALACLMLTSKYLYNTLSPGFELRMEGFPDERSVFIRLLEKDLPQMVVCYSCEILFDWREKSRWRCPNHSNHPFFDFDPIWCYAHEPGFISREMVDLFVRGHELGPEYGPQLYELAHSCDKDGGWFRTRGRKVARVLDARIQQGRLLLHGVYSLTAPIPTFSIDPEEGYYDRSWEYALMREMGKFNGIGCIHLRTALPAIILEAVRQLRLGVPNPLCEDLVNCGYCATDLRVRALTDFPGQIILQVETWRSFGGRDMYARDPLEDAHFQIPGVRNIRLDINQPPSRNLQQLYNGGSVRRTNMLQLPPHRQTWLQRWKWSYADYTEQLWVDLINLGGSAIAVRVPRPGQPKRFFILRETIKDIFDAMKLHLQALKASRHPWFWT
ncbi:hypothetical protein AYL99_09767 [Fonsecaea erecta]|uniref:F-box domain-containing protein n=1 Tax=Fonsecaea erecta TaxID=1367422 RepID=A0A178Z856_9EURO|nr:hypothetical protein AYL99_09767 [Fonsecaea erecta]OAP55616.1 hypothetical protein AYL99_09767 [Fonsecaea erecta]